MKALWKGATLAESDDTVVVDGNHYFPPDCINREYFVESPHHTTCSWKGRASYYAIKVGEEINEDAAWYYPDPKPAAEGIRGHIAFGHGVKVIPSGYDRSDGKAKSYAESWWKRLVGVGS